MPIDIGSPETTKTTQSQTNEFSFVCAYDTLRISLPELGLVYSWQDMLGSCQVVIYQCVCTLRKFFHQLVFAVQSGNSASTIGPRLPFPWAQDDLRHLDIRADRDFVYQEAFGWRSCMGLAGGDYVNLYTGSWRLSVHPARAPALSS